MDNISDYEEPDGCETTYGNLNLADSEIPQPQAVKRWSGRLPQASIGLLQLLVSLGLFLLLMTVLVQIGPPQKPIQTDLYAISQQLARMSVSLGRFCRPCPWIWTEFQGSCYLLFSSQRKWNDALSVCQHLNALLVVINSEAEEKFLQSWKARDKKDVWIGLSDSHSEGTWRWVDNTPLKSSFWMEGEPNDRFGEDCVTLQNDGWNDNRCMDRKRWICEKPAVRCSNTGNPQFRP